MNTSRHTEVNVLGYRIEHVSARVVLSDIVRGDDGHVGGLDSWREVLCPVSGSVLARFSSRAEAERYIIDRELDCARRAARRNAA